MIMAAAAAAPESTVGVLSSSFLTQSDERQAQMMWSMHTGDENAPWPTFVACPLGGGLHWSYIEPKPRSHMVLILKVDRVTW